MSSNGLYDDPNRYAEQGRLELGAAAQFYGYQQFTLTGSSISVSPRDTKLKTKQEMVRKFFSNDWLKGRSVLDLGANSAFFCFYGLHSGAAKATAVDIDEVYLEMVGRARDHFSLNSLNVVKANVVDYQEPADLVMAFALIHWIYSCTATLGSLDATIGVLSNLTQKALIVEWIDPSDTAIQFFGHLDWNKDSITGPYTREAFEEALRTHFDEMEVLGEISPTRIVYAAYRDRALKPRLLPEQPPKTFRALHEDLRRNRIRFRMLPSAQPGSLEFLVDPAHAEKLKSVLNLDARGQVALRDEKGVRTSVNVVIHQVGDGYLPEAFAERLLNQEEAGGYSSVLPPKEAFLVLLYHVVFHVGIMREPFCSSLKALAEQAGMEYDVDTESNFQRACALLEENGLDTTTAAWTASTIELPYLAAPHHVLSSRLLAFFENKSYVSRVYRLEQDGKPFIRKQTSHDLAAREHHFLSQLDAEYFPRSLALQEAEGTSVLDIEFIDGEMLSEPFSAETDVETVRGFIRHCLTLLEHLERQGIAHRDIRKVNVMRRNGVPVLLDFGWASSTATPYAAPQGLGSEALPPDGTPCDVYGMGILLRFLCAFHPEVSHVTEAMTRPTRSSRLRDLAELRRMLDEEQPSLDVMEAACLEAAGRFMEEGQSEAARAVLKKLPASSTKRLAMSLPERRGFNVFCVDDGSQALEASLEAFLEAFEPSDDVAMHILPSRSPEETYEHLAEWLTLRGLDPERIPEVNLLDETLADFQLENYRSIADVVLGADAVIADAERLGLPAIARPTRESLMEARRAVSGRGRCSLVVVTYNSMQTLERCLESALATMAPDDELLVIDNASVDGTPAYLSRLEAQDRRIRVTLSERNLGFSAASNVGLKQATGDYLVLLNPDTVVTSGWLERLCKPFADASVGAVGPTSDYVAGLQKVQIYLPTSPLESMSIQDVAAQLASSHAGKVVETKLLIGFCLMISRQVMDTVGMLDEELFLGNDDLDLSWRLRLKGYRLVVAADAFVHHVGQVSFKTEPSERTRKLVQESTDALARKLVKHYGAGKVPTATELWGISWFEPTPGILDGQTAPSLALRSSGEPGLTSIVLLGYNQLAYTKLCVESVLAHTDVPFEFILVDNGSTDGTDAYFKEMEAQDSRIRAVINPRNLGFALGCNQGIALARGEYVLFLNNDTLVPRKWLSRLRAHLETRPGVGAVGAVSNWVSGPQQLEHVPFANHPDARAEMLAFAEGLAQGFHAQGFELARLVGFCLMVRKSLLDTIGGFDPRFGIGNFEDDDLCLRIRTTGYQTWVAKDVYVHHFGSRTFAALGFDAFEETMDQGWALFKEKWGLPASLDRRNPYRVTLPAFDSARHHVALPSTEDAEYFAPADPFQPGTAPLDLEERRGFTFFHHPDWAQASWRQVLETYLRAFSADQDVSLVLWLDPLQGVALEDASRRILEVMENLGVSPEEAPDLILVPDVLDRAGMASLYAAANCILLMGDSPQEARARGLGVRCLRAPSAEELRDAARALLNVPVLEA